MRDDEIIENPTGYRDTLIRAGIISRPISTVANLTIDPPKEDESERRPCVVNPRGRLCYKNPDGSLERIHFHQRYRTTWKDGKCNVKGDIFMPGQEFEDSHGTDYVLGEDGAIRRVSGPIKGKAQKKAAKRERVKLLKAEQATKPLKENETVPILYRRERYDKV